MNVSRLFDQIDQRIKLAHEIKSKEKVFISDNFLWSVHLMYNKAAMFKKWNVVVLYKDNVMIDKSFRKYEDALKFYEACVREVKKRYNSKR